MLCIYTHKKESEHEELLYLSGYLIFVHIVLARTSIYILFTCFLLMWQKLIEDTTKHAKDTLRDLMFSWGAERITNSDKFAFMAWYLFIDQSINQFYTLFACKFLWGKDWECRQQQFDILVSFSLNTFIPNWRKKANKINSDLLSRTWRRRSRNIQ